jgi:hypothetical protein
VLKLELFKRVGEKNAINEEKMKSNGMLIGSYMMKEDDMVSCRENSKKEVFKLKDDLGNEVAELNVELVDEKKIIRKENEKKEIDTGLKNVLFVFYNLFIMIISEPQVLKICFFTGTIFDNAGMKPNQYSLLNVTFNGLTRSIIPKTSNFPIYGEGCSI